MLEAAWRAGILPRPRLERDVLVDAALRGAPPSDLGPEAHWQEPLDRLLASLRDEAALNPLGLAMAHGQIVMMLRARMRATRLWQAHPDILDRPLSAPIVILGQMRSGTTRLQRLLACDPRFAFTRTYQSLIPVPFATRPARRDGRAWRARVMLALLHRLNPELARIHPTAADAPEEEFGLFGFGFGSAQYEAQWRVPSFARWWEQADRRPLYRDFRTLLQTNGWFRREDPSRPHILKAPQFLQDLPALLGVFPDARLIRLRRDPGEAVASAASLVWNQMRLQSDAADPAWIGREWLGKTRLRERIADDALAARPDVRCLDMDYGAMNRDWQAEMRRIYDFLGLELAPEPSRRMHRYLAGAGAHRGHLYSLDQFGLTPAEVERTVARTQGDALIAAR
jgi:hypothetical protein